MLTAARMRAVLSARHDKIAEELKRRQDQTGKTADEIVAEDPFFAGQMYLLGMIEMDLLIAVQK